MESPTEDSTNDAAPQPNVSDTAAAVDEEQAPPEPISEPPPETSIPAQAVQPPVQTRKRTKLPWPHGSGLPGFGAYTGKKWYNSDTEEQDENDDPPRPRRSFPVPKYKDRHLENEQTSDPKPPGDISDDKPLGSGKGHHGISETEIAMKNRYNQTANFLSGLPSGPIGYSGRFGSRPDKGSGGRFNLGPDTSSSGPNPEQPGTG